MEKSALRIAFTGPESSGKTTLARWTANFFSLPYIPEFAREYLEEKPQYQEADLVFMAQKQVEWWPQGALVADTEMHVFQIWSQEKFERLDAKIYTELNRQVFDHYFLCAPDIPWEEDPLRENPLDRERLFTIYENELLAHLRNFTVLRGDLQTRQEVIKVIISSLMKA
jgi:nicotinamide riboside kinase